ncbi:MAG: hypothetical protein A2Z35_06185 [Actinobacteria bacterium RBG_19FT_COMBO_36_27]|nr:MAG: hypothetical protein A2Z35_06185 [Actinobacteria bacterium RBG_19FT_COMBO_36_27]
MIQLERALNVRDVGYTFEKIAPKTKEHLAVYCSVVLNNRFPHPAYCPDHDSPLDAIWAAYAEIEDFSIWYAMRGSGKTYDLSILAWLESLFKPQCGTTVLGGSLEQSTKAVGYLDYLWRMPGVPHEMLINGSVAGRGFKLNNGSWVQALAASPKSVRGPHPQKLRLDELDEMDRVIYDAALGQPKSNHGIKDNVVISSTLHHAFGLMTEVIDEREKIGARLYKWCVEEVREPRGFWTNDEIGRKLKQLTTAMWDSEYLLKRPMVGDTVFDFESVDRAYRRGFNILFEKYPAEGCIDWGYTCTVLHVIQDFKEYINVPESYSWEYTELTERCKLIVDICIEKNIRVIYCDSNPKDSHMTLRKIIKKKRAPVTVIPIAFNVWKDIAINVVRFYLERDLMNIRDKVFQDKMKKYHYKNVDLEIIDKVDDHYPDALIAWGASRWRILGDITPPRNAEELNG